MVLNDLPTPEQFEEAQKAAENDNLDEIEHFWGVNHVDEFDEYSELMSYAAAKKAESASESAYETQRTLDSYESAAKGLLLGIGAVALVEALIGDARF
jgi:hypothetical protein